MTNIIKKMRELYPMALPAEALIDDVLRMKKLHSSYEGYECLFVTATSTRPSMANSIHADDLSADNWIEILRSKLDQAKACAKHGEQIFYDPWGIYTGAGDR